MSINKRKKNSRQRGSKTHGWGSMKKHRGAGSRGGRGKAGSGKRGDQKKTQYWGLTISSLRGIKKKSPKKNIINVQTIESKLDKWLASKKIEKKNDTYIINLDKLGYGKLLSKNLIKSKLDITVKECSKKVKEKIEKAGGKVNILPKKERYQPKQKDTTQDKKKIEEKTKDKPEKTEKEEKQSKSQPKTQNKKKEK
tara:strand:- start:1488 stop:2075 length:588 start_codon:yes stop_codon:yes gene_type:complete